MILVDTSVLLDVVTDDPTWKPWSLAALEAAAAADRLVINDIVYAELSVRYRQIEDVENFIDAVDLELSQIPRPALFAAAKAYQRYRSIGGTRPSVLPDFFIGAHAAVTGAPLLTRDARRHRTYFPNVQLITPP